jgi:hypothetical protein
MSIVSGLMIALALSGAVDPTSARARARRHEAALVTAEAALLAGDASAALAAVHTIDADDRRLDQRRLRQVRARALLGVGDAAAARVDLIALLAEAPDGTADDIRRQLADAERSLGNFDACDDALAGLVVVEDADRIARATCLRGTTRRAQAHDVLADGAAVPLRRLRLQLWLEDGAPRQARPDAFALVDTQPASDVLAWARAFADAGDDTAARALVEGLVGRADLDIETASGVARLLATGGRSQVLQASLLLPGLADARREQGDAAGAWRAAVALAGSDRLRQRAALLVDAGAWERLWLLWPRLKAGGLADDDEVAYAVAFAAVTTDRLDEAEAVLDGVTGAATFARATALRARIKSLQACRSSATRESPCTP